MFWNPHSKSHPFILLLEREKRLPHHNSCKSVCQNDCAVNYFHFP